MSSIELEIEIDNRLKDLESQELKAGGPNFGCRISRKISDGQISLTNNTENVIDMTTIFEDTDNMADLANDRIWIRSGGVYVVGFAWHVSGRSGPWETGIRLNGSGYVARAYFKIPSSGAPSTIHYNVRRRRRFAANDYLEPIIFPQQLPDSFGPFATQWGADGDLAAPTLWAQFIN